MHVCVPCYSLLHLVCAHAKNMRHRSHARPSRGTGSIDTRLIQTVELALTVLRRSRFLLPGFDNPKAWLNRFFACTFSARLQSRQPARDIAAVMILYEKYMLLSQQLALHTAVAPYEKSY